MISASGSSARRMMKPPRRPSARPTTAPPTDASSTWPLKDPSEGATPPATTAAMAVYATSAVPSLKRLSPWMMPASRPGTGARRKA